MEHMSRNQDLSREDVERITQALHFERLIHSCMTCRHFAERGAAELGPATPAIPVEHCGLYKVRPPARVIAYGCPSWEDDLPF